MPNWSESDFVIEHVERAAKHLADEFKRFTQVWYANSSLESPLEAVFEIWWRALTSPVEDIYINRQREVVTTTGKRYRLDFSVEPRPELVTRAKRVGIQVPLVAIELDGHEFHERTKEQVAYRNQRDRDLLADGWSVLHYSGSEMHREPVRCVTDAIAYGRRAFSWDWEVSIMKAEDEAAQSAAEAK